MACRLHLPECRNSNLFAITNGGIDRMRNIRTGVSFAAAVALFAVLSSGAHAQLWYNGDFDGNSGLANERDAIVSDSRIYDDFIIPVGQTWTLTSVFSNNLSALNTTNMDWEIRQGVSAGNGG